MWSYKTESHTCWNWWNFILPFHIQNRNETGFVYQSSSQVYRREKLREECPTFELCFNKEGESNWTFLTAIVPLTWPVLKSLKLILCSFMNDDHQGENCYVLLILVNSLSSPRDNGFCNVMLFLLAVNLQHWRSLFPTPRSAIWACKLVKGKPTAQNFKNTQNVQRRRFNFIHLVLDVLYWARDAVCGIRFFSFSLPTSTSKFSRHNTEEGGNKLTLVERIHRRSIMTNERTFRNAWNKSLIDCEVVMFQLAD